MNSSKSLQIPCWLAPLVLEHDIGQRNTANRPEPAHWIAERQQRIGANVGRQAKSGLSFLLDGAVAIDKDIQRYLTAHGEKDEHVGYGEYPVRDLKAAIEWVRNPLVQEDFAEAAE